MTDAPFRVAALDTAIHERSRFDCGTPALNRYLREQAAQDMRRRVAACFVALAGDGSIAGYYTLASASVPLPDLPPDWRRKLPRYAAVPAIRMGRLAVDGSRRGQGLGSALLVDALRRAAQAEIAAAAMIVDAKDEAAAAFYRHHGFLPLETAPLALALPLALVR